MAGYGRHVLLSTGIPINIVASNDFKFGMIGKTVDWSKVAALASDYTDASGITVPAGRKMLRFGQHMTTVTATGLIGPYDPAAADGRQNVQDYRTAGLLNETIVQGGLDGNGLYNDTNLGLIIGGFVYIDRVLHAGTGTASLAAGPQLAALLAALPDLRQFRL